MTGSYPADVPTAAQWWYDRGATVAPASTYRKGPHVKDWQILPREKLRGLFERGDNLALRTGDGGIADVDYDDDFATRVGANFVPATGVVYGRVGNPNSHRIYHLEDDGRGYVKYCDPLNGSKLLELRGCEARDDCASVCQQRESRGHLDGARQQPRAAQRQLCGAATCVRQDSGSARPASLLALPGQSG
jgi:hypothetical protein